MFDENNLKLKFLLGKAILLNGIGILKPLKIDEISEIGFDLYNKYLGILCLTKSDVSEMVNIPEEEMNFEPYDYLISCCHSNEDSKKLILDSISLFFNSKVKYNKELGYFEIGDFINGGILHRENFNFTIDILKQQNCLNRQDDKPKPKNEKEKEFFRELEEKRRKYQSKENTITDIISAVCSKHPSINVFNVVNLTIYQLIDQYKRLNCIDEYFIAIDSLLHGAEKKDVNLVHWSSRIN